MVSQKLKNRAKAGLINKRKFPPSKLSSPRPRKHLRTAIDVEHDLTTSHSEKPSGKCCNKADLDEQSHYSFCCSESSIRVSQRDVLREEPTSVETAHTEDKCFIPGQMWGHKVGGE